GGGGGGGVIDVGVKESRHSSSTTTNSSSQSPSPWLPVENPVALSRDAYLKVTQDGYLNRSTIDDILDDDDELAVDDDLVGGVDDDDDESDLTSGVRSAQSSILLARSLRGTGGFSPSASPLFSSPISSTLFQKQQSSGQQQRSVTSDQSSSLQQGVEGELVDDGNDDVVVIRFIIHSQEDAGGDGELEEEEEEVVGGPSFGAGEAAEDTATLYEEFKSISSHQWIPYEDDGGGEKADMEVGEGWRNGCVNCLK
ncbi:unnamed protein product, partial [Hymenolepis diminuta]